MEGLAGARGRATCQAAGAAVLADAQPEMSEIRSRGGGSGDGHGPGFYVAGGQILAPLVPPNSSTQLDVLDGNPLN